LNQSPIILASGSGIRRRILDNAGVRFEVERPDVDEDAIKARFPTLNDQALALRLAEEKALEVSRRRDGLCLGADQILSFDGQRFDKPASMDEARGRLKAMAGKQHALLGGAAIARAGAILWRHESRSCIHMRRYSEAFLNAYLRAAGEAILSSVACYQYEGLGAQLFERVEGDYYAILGLPILPVLAALRDLGAMPE